MNAPGAASIAHGASASSTYSEERLQIRPDVAILDIGPQVWTVEGSTLTVETMNARGTQKRVYKK